MVSFCLMILVLCMKRGAIVQFISHNATKLFLFITVAGHCVTTGGQVSLTNKIFVIYIKFYMKKWRKKSHLHAQTCTVYSNCFELQKIKIYMKKPLFWHIFCQGKQIAISYDLKMKLDNCYNNNIRNVTLIFITCNIILQ